jgi:hypothetical protein
LDDDRIFQEAVILNEVDWFYNGLGLNEYYFQHHSPQIIAKHILAFIAAKQYAHTTGTNENIRYRSKNIHKFESLLFKFSMTCVSD